MNRRTQDTLLILFGGIMLRVGVTDLHLRFVKPQMQGLIVLSAVILIALGVAGLVQQVRAAVAARPSAEVSDAAATGADVHVGHAHGAPRTAWLLALPLFVLLLVAPPPLGADAVNRSASVTLEPSSALPPLRAPRDGAVDLTLGDYAQRASFATESLEGATVRLVGFAVPDGQGWLLARLSLSCCAADGRPSTVRMTGAQAQSVPPQDTWFEVEGRYVPGIDPGDGRGRAAALEVTSLTRIKAPRSPYETR